MKIGKMRKLRISIFVVLTSLTMTGCSTSYKSSFGCADPSGADCTSIEKVYYMVKSGEIEELSKEKRKCRGGACRAKSTEIDEVPILSTTKIKQLEIDIKKQNRAR